MVRGDIVGFRCAVAHNNADNPGLPIWETNEMLHRILGGLNADKYEIYLSGVNNFRKDIDPEYKANRKDTPRPIYLEDVREALIKDWKAHVTDWYEADDALGIAASGYDISELTIASDDKDLKQIPGRHYNIRTQVLEEVSPLQSLQNFYKQFLIGDRADNIFGVDGIGKVKAERIIGPLDNELDMFDAVRMYYDNDERLLKNGRLLYILRSEHDKWNFPSERTSEMETAQ